MTNYYKLFRLSFFIKLKRILIVAQEERKIFQSTQQIGCEWLKIYNVNNVLTDFWKCWTFCNGWFIFEDVGHVWRNIWGVLSNFGGIFASVLILFQLLCQKEDCVHDICICVLKCIMNMEKKIKKFDSITAKKIYVRLLTEKCFLDRILAEKYF